MLSALETVVLDHIDYEGYSLEFAPPLRAVRRADGTYTVVVGGSVLTAIPRDGPVSVEEIREAVGAALLDCLRVTDERLETFGPEYRAPFRQMQWTVLLAIRQLPPGLPEPLSLMRRGRFVSLPDEQVQWVPEEGVRPC